jgi:hypothetical protein
MYPLKNNFQRGDTANAIPHDMMNTLANFYNTLQVIGGTFDRTSDGRDCKINVASLSAKAASIVPEPWDIVKSDGDAGKVWIRKGKVIHNAGASSTQYELSGNGAVNVFDDTESTAGFQLTAGERFVMAKLTVPTGVELTLHEAAAIPADTATAVYWPLWKMDWAGGKVTRQLRLTRGHVKATVWQLLTGWDATAKRALDTNTSGVLVWSETGDCEE